MLRRGMTETLAAASRVLDAGRSLAPHRRTMSAEQCVGPDKEVMKLHPGDRPAEISEECPVPGGRVGRVTYRREPPPRAPARNDLDDQIVAVTPADP